MRDGVPQLLGADVDGRVARQRQREEARLREREVRVGLALGARRIVFPASRSECPGSIGWNLRRMTVLLPETDGTKCLTFVAKPSMTVSAFGGMPIWKSTGKSFFF